MEHSPLETDEALMAAVQRRDGAAFDVLALRCRPALAARLASLLRSAAAADDILQETLLRAWTHADQWDGRGPVRAWMSKIATNLALNHLRAERRRREDPIDAADSLRRPGRSDAPGGLPGRAVEEAETRAQLRGLVSALPQDKRDVLRMVCDDDLSLLEVAEKLGIPEGTVKSRLHHARKWLSAQWALRESEGKDLR